jgi:hypothetical protein
MPNHLYIDDNIFLFDIQEENNNNVFIQIKQNNNTIISKMVSHEFDNSNVFLYFDNHISLKLKKINNNVSEYQLLLNVITYKNFIKRFFLNYKHDKNGSKILYDIWAVLTCQENYQ